MWSSPQLSESLLSLFGGRVSRAAGSASVPVCWCLLFFLEVLGGTEGSREPLCAWASPDPQPLSLCQEGL